MMKASAAGWNIGGSICRAATAGHSTVRSLIAPRRLLLMLVSTPLRIVNH